MMNWRMWLRWSWRDLKARWMQVVAISLIIALGTAIFAAFGGQEQLRSASYDKSYAMLNAYDLHIAFANGSFVPQAELLTALDGIEGVKALETRLIVPTQLDGGEEVLVEGELVGVEVAENSPHINGIYINDGRNLASTDSGQPVAVIDYKFAQYHQLQAGDAIKIAGNIPLDFVGTGQMPDYFMIIPETGNFMGEATFAPIFMPLESVQNISGHEGMVNDVVIQLAAGADRKAVQAELEARLASSFPAMGATINTRQEDAAYAMLYTDAKNDQGTWDLLSGFFLFGASLAAFNLAGRMVQAQRREIGIGMALGVPRRIIAIRPMLVGLQIAILGTLFGLGIGLVFTVLMSNIMEDFVPMPYYEPFFNWTSFVKAAFIGIGLPFVATLIPTVRAIRVAPIDAIRSGHLVAKQGGLARYLDFIPMPKLGKSFTQMPFRNILRSPWRTLFTIFGVSIAVILLTLFIGIVDTFTATINQSEAAYRYKSADRVLVTLDSFYATDDRTVTHLATLTNAEGQPLFTDWVGQIELGGNLSHADQTFETGLTLLPMDNDIWTPKLLEGKLPQQAGEMVLSSKMAEDLGVEVGDTVMLEHPRRAGLYAFSMVESEVKVVGIHDNPLRPLTYMDIMSADSMGIAGVINELVVVSDADKHTVKTALFNEAGVGAVQPVSDYSKAIQEAMGLLRIFLRVIQVVVMFLAFLIAFNSTSINVDERVREIATMFAFGLPLRTVTRMQIVENLVIGVLGTALGAVLGWVLLNEMLAVRLEEQLEDMQFIVQIAPTTFLISISIGVLVVALTPLLSIRKMLKMNIPGALRVME